MHQTAATLIRIHARAFTNASRRSMSSAAAASQAQQTKAPRSLAALLACPQDYERTKPLRVDMPDGAPQPTVSIMDFNILARVYCDGARRFAKHATPEFLAWNWRRERIHQLILDASPDVVCCQEIVQAEFDSVEIRAAREKKEEERLAKVAAKEAALNAKKLEMQRKAEKRAATTAARRGPPASSDAAAENGSAASAPADESADASAPVSARVAADESDAPATAAPASAASSEPAATGAAANPSVPYEPAADADPSAASWSPDQPAPPPFDADSDFVDPSTLAASYVPPVEGDFSTFLQRNGYAWAVQEPAKKSDKYPVGVAVFWKTSKFWEKPVVFDSRSRAIVVALKMRLPSETALPSAAAAAAAGSSSAAVVEPPATLRNTLFIANVHLQGHYDEVSTRLNQVKSLFKQIEKHVAYVESGAAGREANAAAGEKKKAEKKNKKGDAAAAAAAGATADATAAAPPAAVAASSSAPSAAAAPGSPSTPMLILTGDFNQHERYSSVHLLATRGLVPSDFLDGSVNRVVNPGPNSEAKQPWPLASVYAAEHREPQFLPKYTYHNNHYPGSPYNNVLDYIYHSKPLRLLASMKVLNGPEEEALVERTSLPNELIPSDHLPVGATFYVEALDVTAKSQQPQAQAEAAAEEQKQDSTAKQ